MDLLREDSYYEFKPFRVAKYQIKFSNAAKLSDVPGYVWYSPAALYLWGRFTEKNLSDLVAKYDFKIFWYRFERPIFSGFEFNQDSSWNSLLWAAEEEVFPKIVDGILETVQFDLDRDLLYQYALQKLKIYDPLNTDISKFVGPKTPIVEINAFAVLSNLRQCAFPVKGNTAAVPRMVSYPPDQLHVRAADRLFSISHKNTDSAFTAYKQIMLDEQEIEYQRAVNEQRAKGLKNVR
jgi:hypothetical protein